MLEGLDNVEWSAVRHACGPATDLPDLLRSLASEDPKVREDACDRLMDTIVHQMSIYSGTIAAVPFLIELAAQPSVQDRDGILWLLFWIFNSGFEPEYWHSIVREPGGIEAIVEREYSQMRGGQPPLSEEVAQELREWIHDEIAARGQAVEAVEQGYSVYLHLLGDDHPPVRLVSLRLLGGMARRHSEVLDAIRTRLPREQDEEVLVAMVQRLGTIGAGAGWAPDACRDYLTHPSLSVRAAAAAALVDLQPEDSDPDALELLATLYADPVAATSLKGGLPEIPRLDQDIDKGRLRLKHLGPGQVASMAKIMIGGLDAIAPLKQRRVLAEQVIALLFRYPRVRECNEPPLPTLRREALHRVVPLLSSIVRFGDDQWETFKAAQVLMRVLNEYAAPHRDGAEWLASAWRVALLSISESSFWYRNYQFIPAFARELLSGVFAELRGPEDLSEEARALIAVIVATMDLRGAGPEKSDLVALLAQHGVITPIE